MTDYKSLGNAALQQKDFAAAIEFYTKGLQEEPENHVLLSNRAAAYLSNGSYQQAADDAAKSVVINNGWVKGYIRQAQALVAMNRHEEALPVIQAGLKIENQNPILLNLRSSVLENSRSANAAMNIFSKLQDPKLMDKVREHTVLKQFATQPDFVEMIKEIQEDNSKIGNYLGDMRLMLVLKEICGLDIQMPSQEDMMKREQEEYENERLERKRKEEEELKKQKAEEETKSLLPENQEKLAGNAAYLKKDFETALKHYNNAIEINPKEITFRLNRASVLIETGKYEESIKTCEEALEIARETRAGYEDVAKIYAKIGNTYFRANEFEKAVEAYKNAQLEHRTRPVALQLKKVEELLEKRQKEQYLDPKKAEEARERGAEFFRQQKFPEAKKEYDEAIKRDPTNHLSYSNRAAAYIKLGAIQYALKDLEECLKIDPTFVKAYIRKGQCHTICKEYHKALKAFDEGLKLDPKNQELITRRQQLVSMISSSESEEDKARRREQALKDPEIQNILGDPQFQHVLNQLSTDPHAAAELMRDPQVKERVEKLIAAGVLEIK